MTSLSDSVAGYQAGEPLGPRRDRGFARARQHVRPSALEPRLGKRSKGAYTSPSLGRIASKGGSMSNNRRKGFVFFIAALLSCVAPPAVTAAWEENTNRDGDEYLGMSFPTGGGRPARHLAPMTCGAWLSRSTSRRRRKRRCARSRATPACQSGGTAALPGQSCATRTAAPFPTSAMRDSCYTTARTLTASSPLRPARPVRRYPERCRSITSRAASPAHTPNRACSISTSRAIGKRLLPSRRGPRLRYEWADALRAHVGHGHGDHCRSRRH